MRLPGRERYFSTEARNLGHGNGVIKISCVHPDKRRDGRDDRHPTSKPCALREGWSGACATEDARPKSPSRRVFLPWTGGATRPTVNTERT